MTSITLNDQEIDAVLAALHLLQLAVESDQFGRDGALVHAIYTNSNEHEGLSLEGIHALAERIDGGE